MFPSALTVAGVDTCGGAGVAADLKTFGTLGIHGACVITALTAQNTKGIPSVLGVNPKFVEEQLQAVLDDLKIQVAKTGVLYGEEVVRVVAKFVEDYGLKVVVDPIFQSATGEKLATKEAIKAYIERLLPLATVATPNIP